MDHPDALEHEAAELRRRHLDGATDRPMRNEFKAAAERSPDGALYEALRFAAQSLAYDGKERAVEPVPLIGLLERAATAIQIHEMLSGDLRTDAQRSRWETDSWRSRLTDQLARYERLGGECRTLEAQKGALMTANADLRSRVEELEAGQKPIAHLRAKIQSLEKQAAQWQLTVDRLGAELAAAKARKRSAP